MTKSYLGEALPKRPSQRTTKLKNNGGFVTNLDGVSVDVRTTETGGSYTMPTLHGVEFDRMRRYGLVLNRWAIADSARRAKRSGNAHSAYVAASRVVSNHMFRQAFDGEDPSKDTVNITPYVNAIKAETVTPELLHAVIALHGTDAFHRILSQIPTTSVGNTVRDGLLNISQQLSDYYVGSKAHYFGHLRHIHSDNKRHVRYGYRYYEAIVDVIHHQAKHTSREVEAKKASAKPKKAKGKQQPSASTTTKATPHKTVREIADPDGWWEKPFVAKYPLELPHTGKLGRREIATNEGKYPKAFYRLVTDPYRRIFKRKTRSLGGVVVFDCSGSMGLTEDDIHKVLKASAGCSILCYSSSGDEARDRKNGNIHIVAKNGRQMRYLPNFPGGNGVDLPALRYGFDHLRQNGRSPVIWVSDGEVTGKGDHSNSNLRQATQKYIRQHGIIQVTDVEDAIELLAKLQKGIKS